MFSAHRVNSAQIINKFLATALALPYSKSVCMSQNRKFVCRSQKVCLYLCVSYKIENMCVSHKILIQQVLPRGSDRGGWQCHCNGLLWFLLVPGGLHVEKLPANLV